MDITRETVQRMATNASAMKNAESLVRSGSYSGLGKDAAGVVIFGNCRGSSGDYSCYADFSDSAKPVTACSCPSRQIPCKHVIGLMLAYAQGVLFEEGEVPQAVLNARLKREQQVKKAAERSEKVKPESGVPKAKTAAQKRAAIKKIESQISGIEQAEKILHNILSFGMGSIDSKNSGVIMRNVAGLDSFYILGVQARLSDLVMLIKTDVSHAKKLETVCEIGALLTKGKAYLTEKLNDPEMIDTKSEIEELLGYAWKLDELATQGLVEADARLVELAFCVQTEQTRFVDEGIVISLNSGKIYRTKNFRPFRALNHLKEQNSTNGVMVTPMLYTYPGLAMNPRVRFEDFSVTAVCSDDLEKILGYALGNYAAVIKAVKGQLMNLTLDRSPVCLLEVTRLESAGGDEFVVTDANNTPIYLKNLNYSERFFFQLMRNLPTAEPLALLVVFGHDAERGELLAQPLCAVTRERLIKLV